MNSSKPSKTRIHFDLADELTPEEIGKFEASAKAAGAKNITEHFLNNALRTPVGAPQVITVTRRDGKVYICDLAFDPALVALVGLSILNAALEVPTASESLLPDLFAEADAAQALADQLRFARRRQIALARVNEKDGSGHRVRHLGRIGWLSLMIFQGSHPSYHLNLTPPIQKNEHRHHHPSLRRIHRPQRHQGRQSVVPCQGRLRGAGTRQRLSRGQR